MTDWVGFVAALVIGGILGLLGAGGSILAVPVFTYAVGMPPKLAIVSSLVVVAVASVFGGIRNLTQGNVDIRRGALFLAGSIPGAFLGGLLGQSIDDGLQISLFALVMLTAAIAMLGSRGSSANVDTVSGDDGVSTVRMLARIAASVFVGLVTGIVGAGGGFLIVPALTVLFAVRIRVAIGTSMLVIAINSAASLVGYLSDAQTFSTIRSTMIGGMPMPLYLTVFSAIMIGGVIVIGRIGARLQAQVLRIVFASFLIALGLAMVFLNMR